MSYEISNAKAIHETDRAVLVEANDFDEPQWIPQSQIDDDSDVYKKGTEGTLIVTDWFARKQGWV